MTNRNSFSSDIVCNDVNTLAYRNNRNERKYFEFSNTEKCDLVLNCIKNLQENEIVRVRVDRSTKKIREVVLPASCEIDPWASQTGMDIGDKV